MRFSNLWISVPTIWYVSFIAGANIQSLWCALQYNLGSYKQRAETYCFRHSDDTSQIYSIVGWNWRWKSSAQKHICIYGHFFFFFLVCHISYKYYSLKMNLTDLKFVWTNFGWWNNNSESNQQPHNGLGVFWLRKIHGKWLELSNENQLRICIEPSYYIRLLQ